MNTAKFRVVGAVAVTIVITISAGAMTATETIKERQKEMNGVREAMMTFAAIAKKEQPFDADVVRTTAEKMAGHLDNAGKLFPDGTGEGEVQTWAKSEIWSDGAQFDKLMMSTHQAAVDLQSVTEAEAFGPALGKLGHGCKSCHDLYRLPKN
jgi:cytochrome c556